MIPGREKRGKPGALLGKEKGWTVLTAVAQIGLWSGNIAVSQKIAQRLCAPARDGILTPEQAATPLEHISQAEERPLQPAVSKDRVCCEDLAFFHAVKHTG